MFMSMFYYRLLRVVQIFPASVLTRRKQYIHSSARGMDKPSPSLDHNLNANTNHRSTRGMDNPSPSLGHNHNTDTDTRGMDACVYDMCMCRDRDI